MKKKIGFLALGVLIFALALTGTASAEPITILRDFTGPPDLNYAEFNNNLIAVGGTLYGMACGGGTSDQGAIFSINPDGTGYTFLHSISAGAGEGENPRSTLLYSGGMLYGASYVGGVFSMPLDGSSFNTQAFDVTTGTLSTSGLAAGPGSQLYGMTQVGGASGGGVLYSISNTLGAMTPVYNFNSADGTLFNPQSNPIVDGSNIYGIATLGGANGVGGVFVASTDGTSFASLHDFGGAGDGTYPYGALLLYDGRFYGTTAAGGDYGAGTIYSMDEDGSNYAVLGSFDGTNGNSPMGYLDVDVMGKLYGTTAYGGDYGAGTIFAIMSDGTGFHALHSFAGGASDGAVPYGSLLLESGKLYGMTLGGGSVGRGVLFSMNAEATPEPATIVSGLLGLFGLAGKRLFKRKKGKS